MKGFFVIAVSLIAACSSEGQKKITENKSGDLTITVNGADIVAGQDNCIELKDPVHRDFQIIENTLSDTVTLGYGILGPGVTGEFLYLKDGENFMLYPETPKKFLPKTKQACLRLYQDQPVNGKIVIKFN